MILSVIIVNYRVRYFLELCLYSVDRALAGLDAETIVVDNASGGGSIGALRTLFPRVRFVENEENVGFGRANNQALRAAGGEYVLFLNPDTIVPEDFFHICLDFLRDKPRAGGVGVRMIDGGGRFLPESNAACFFLADGSRLIPEDRFDRADILRWMFFEQYNHEPNIATLRFWLYFIGKDNLSDEQRAQVTAKRIAGQAALELMDRHLAGRQTNPCGHRPVRPTDRRDRHRNGRRKSPHAWVRASRRTLPK